MIHFLAWMKEKSFLLKKRIVFILVKKFEPELKRRNFFSKDISTKNKIWARARLDISFSSYKTEASLITALILFK